MNSSSCQFGQSINNNIVCRDVLPKYDLPSFMLSNVRSLLNKIDDVHTAVLNANADIVVLTETHLDESVPDQLITPVGYNIFRKDRCRHGGGVAIFIHKSLPVTRSWTELDSDDIESLWVTVRPNKMPRQFPCILIGAIYHPPKADDWKMVDHIIQCLDRVLQHHPHSGVCILGDFNRMKDKRLKSYPLQQIVRQATRQQAVLDKMYTNMAQFYDSVTVSAPLGLSDHNVLNIACTQTDRRHVGERSYKLVRRSDPNCKTMFVNDLKAVNWVNVFKSTSCQEKYDQFHATLLALMDKHIPFRVVTVCSTDKPWVTPHFKDLISSRQSAWNAGNMVLYRQLRNKVNHMSSKLRSNFFHQKVQDLKSTDSRNWWHQVKKLCGLDRGMSDLKNITDTLYGGNEEALVENINKFFLSICEDIDPLDPTLIPAESTVPDEYVIPLEMVERKLASVKTSKAPGPDGIPSWILHDLPGLIAPPICNIWNASLTQGQLPTLWKCADTIPLPKKTPAKDISQDLRPISLTAVLVKLLESIISKWLKDYIIPSSSQYGGKSGTNTTHALIDFLHNAHMAVNNGHQLRSLFLDYKKAYDHIDHNIVLRKLKNCGAPNFLVRWVASFLSNRQQRVKLGNFNSTWGYLRGSVPQGSCIGPLLFVLMIDDLQPHCHNIKFMDDTTLTEIITKQSKMQNHLDYVIDWSEMNNMVLNANKTKEIRISFSKSQMEICDLKLSDTIIEQVSSFKLLGVTIQNNLIWDSHTENLYSKANRQLFFLRQLKKSGVNALDLSTVYKTKIRPCLEYAAPAWATGITKAQCEMLESIQKRAFRIIFPFLSYSEALAKSKCSSLADRRDVMCRKLFDDMKVHAHPLNKLLVPYTRNCPHLVRKPKQYAAPRVATERCKKSFVNFALYNFQ